MPKRVIAPREATSTGPGFNWGSVGGARGCGFKERAGAYARTEEVISYIPRPLSLSLSLCLLKRRFAFFIRPAKSNDLGLPPVSIGGFVRKSFLSYLIEVQRRE